MHNRTEQVQRQPKDEDCNTPETRETVVYLRHVTLAFLDRAARPWRPE